jgi:VanZ family protein
MADYSMTRWLAPLVLTLWLWGSVPFSRVISDWLRDHGLLQTCIGVAGIAVVLVFVFFVRRQTPSLSGLRWAMLTGLLGLLVLVMMRVVQVPEERVHFLQIGLLAFLVWRALPQTRGALGWAVLAGTLVGAVEETIQIMVPGRVCDWRDIGMSAVAAVVTGLALWVIQGAASFSPMSPPMDHEAGASATTRGIGRLISTVHESVAHQDASDGQRHVPRGPLLDPPFFPIALAQAILHFVRTVLQHIRGDKG